MRFYLDKRICLYLLVPTEPSKYALFSTLSAYAKLNTKQLLATLGFDFQVGGLRSYHLGVKIPPPCLTILEQSSIQQWVVFKITAHLTEACYPFNKKHPKPPYMEVS